jgi:hypothetical protein
MTDTAPWEPPAWVSKRDGRLVPFEADKISRSLFAATETLGRPDAFLARELADGVVHFLTLEGDGTPPSTTQIAELVVKVVRELGQPALAAAYAQHGRQRPAKTGKGGDKETRRQGEEGGSLSPPLLVSLSPRAADAPLVEVLAACTRAYALQAVFTRDLVAAQDAGLLTLTGLDAPDRLADCVLAAPARPGADLTAAVEETARLAGRCVVLDAPEHLLAVSGRADAEGAADLVRRFLLGLRLTGLHAVVNLNCAAPPSWADELAEGPLFDTQRSRPRPDVLLPLGEQMAAAFLEPGPTTGRVRIDWHLGQRDFTPSGRERLLRVARLALDGAPLGFVFDRPRRPVPLAEGVDRTYPAVLLAVGLHLPRLAEQSGVGGDGERFLKKLGSLARLALSAAVQKREHLRRQDRARPADQADAPALTSGFLLDRARLMVAPVGLDAVVRRLSGAGMGEGGASLELGKQIVERLRDVLRQDGRSAHLDACVDGPFDFRVGPPDGGRWPELASAAGVTPWNAATPLKAQFHAGGVLHAAAEAGTLALFVPDDHPLTAEQVAGWLRSLRHAEVVRVRLIRGAPAPRQLTFT